MKEELEMKNHSDKQRLWQIRILIIHFILFVSFLITGIILRNILDWENSPKPFHFQLFMRRETMRKLLVRQLFSSFYSNKYYQQKSSKTDTTTFEGGGKWNLKRHLKPSRSQFLPGKSLMLFTRFLTLKQILKTIQVTFLDKDFFPRE